MQLPASAVKQIENMVRGMLPYEVGYIPETPQSQLLGRLFEAIETPNPALHQWEGFIMYLMKQVDNHPKKQKDVDEIAGAAYDIMTEYGYGDVVRS